MPWLPILLHELKKAIVKSPIERKFARVFYYFRNIVRDGAPQIIFRKRLGAILNSADSYDAAYLSWRLHYYNKLSEHTPAEPYMSTIGTIPMRKSIYYYDLKEHARYFPRETRLNYVFGDVRRVPDRPSLLKSRPIAGDNRNSIVMKLEKFRHFYLPADKIAFVDKKPKVIWRGGERKSNRAALVRDYRGHKLCDVGFTDVGPADSRHAKFMLPTEQMGFKYIISIEGNDVASNLKWILASNSLCLMPAPRFEIWFMEGRLEAGKHYVQVRDDFADLEEKIHYYERHADEALEIIRNANDYVAQFFNEDRERLISLLVLAKYFALTGQYDPDRKVADLIFPANPEASLDSISPAG
jgi:hypothetical protein